MLTIVSKKTERKKGFFQAYYRDKDHAVQILLHRCLSGIVLDRHKHRSLQFGYNFYGDYDFFIGNDLVHIADGDSYLINSLIEHEAYASTEYYSIDIKFHGSMGYDKVINPTLSEKNPLKLNCDKGEIRIRKTRSDVSIDQGNYLIVSHDIDVKIDQNILELKPMEIYLARKRLNIERISSHDKNEFLIITIG